MCHHISESELGKREPLNQHSLGPKLEGQASYRRRMTKLVGLLLARTRSEATLLMKSASLN